MDYRSVSVAKRVLLGLLLGSGVRYAETTDSINVRCPHCGDSKQSKSVRRGFFVFKQDKAGSDWLFYYKCQNGGCEFNKAIGIVRYLTRFHPRAHDEFKALLRGEKASGQQSFSSFDWKKAEEEQRVKIEEETKRRLLDERRQLQYFVPLDKQTPSDIERMYISNAILYCVDRKIPREKFMRFFVAVDGKYKDRIVVPFYMKDQKPSYFQTRAIVKGMEPKYLNRYGNKPFYNLSFVDWSRPVVVTEGAFDSMFFDNSFGLNGISSGSKEFTSLAKESLLMLLDNDSAGQTTAEKLIKEGYSVFLWRRFLADHPAVLAHLKTLPAEKSKLDWNDVVRILDRNEWRGEDIIKYFSRNPLDVPFIRGYRG